MFFPIFLFLLLVLIVLVVSFIILLIRTPDVRPLITKNPDETAFMRIRDRQYNYRPDQKKQTWKELSEISPYLIQAVIAFEDRNFLIHQGFYWEEMWNSLLIDIRERKFVKGGSSITQQLAKNLYLTPSRKIMRKLREALLTFKLERDLTKARILEIYLNVIEWGDNIYGAEEACKYYFKKSASELSLSEAIRLAVCVPNPRRFSALENLNEYLKSQHKQLLFALWKHGWISRPKFMQTYNELYDFYQAGYRPNVLVPFEEKSINFNTPDFWINKIKDPDRLIMNRDDIAVFNQRAGLIGGGIDIFQLPVSIHSGEIKDKIIEVSGFEPFYSLNAEYDNISDVAGNPVILHYFETVRNYDSNNEPLKTESCLNILKKMNVDEIEDKQKVLYAIAVSRTDILAWPEDVFVMNKPYDNEFNRIQLSSLNFADTVAVIHKSKDQEWSFVRTRYVDGWVKTCDLAFASREEIMKYPTERFIVSIRPVCRTEFGAELQAGSRVPFKSKQSDHYKIQIPSRDSNGSLEFIEDAISEELVYEGFLTYTKGNVIRTAFKFLGTAYSLGGYGGGVDCSSFIQGIFSVFGFNFPRNSSLQPAVGNNLCKYSNPRGSIKSRLLQDQSWEPGITLLRFPGHIMLYLGKDEGQVYAIHSVWGIPHEGNKILHINKVSVTDLGLGRGSERGSLQERITDVSIVEPLPSGFRSLMKDFVFALDQHPWNFDRLMKISFILIAVIALVTIFI